MPLNYDQQKNLRSLIDNAGAGTYEEVRNELYDHLVQATESRMAEGLPFTDAQGEALKEMGGEWGLNNIEEGYKEAARQQAGRLFGSFVLVYLKSLRWTIPLVLVTVIRLYISAQFHLWVGLSSVILFMLVVVAMLKRWNYGNPEQYKAGHPVSLRAFVIAERGGFFAPGMMITCTFLSKDEPLYILSTTALLLIFLFADYSLAFVAHARKTWLEIA